MIEYNPAIIIQMSLDGKLKIYKLIESIRINELNKTTKLERINKATKKYASETDKEYQIQNNISILR